MTVEEKEKDSGFKINEYKDPVKIPAVSIHQQASFNRAQRNKFIMVFDLPPLLRDQQNSVDRETKDKPNIRWVNKKSMQFSIHGAPVPAISIPSIELPFSGQTVHLTSYNRPSYSNMKINFVVNNTFDNYWVIWKWLNIFNDHASSTYNQRNSVSFDPSSIEKKSGEYMTNISIMGLDEWDNPIIEFIYKKVFPIGLGDISYSNRDPSNMESSFDFVFTQLECNLLDPCI